jgi:Holliday junction resolvase
MRSYWGKVVNARGSAFAREVASRFVEAGFQVRLEVEMASLEASKKDGLGDIDVLAWSRERSSVFAVECKHLQTAGTVREVVQQLAEFAGDRAERDSLGRHLRRIDWLRQHSSSLAAATGVPVELQRLCPLLVTSGIVPMQFFDNVHLPPSQVVPLSEIPQRIRDF